MSLRSIRHGAIVACDVDTCTAEFVTYSLQRLARDQARGAGWLRAKRWLLEPNLGRGRARVDVCPAHSADVETRASEITKIEAALGRHLQWRALLVGQQTNALTLRMRERVAKKLAERGKEAAIEAYLALIRFNPLAPASRDTVAEQPEQGSNDADRPRALESQANHRQSETDQEGDQGRRRPPRRDRTDHDEQRGSEHGGDPNDRACAPRRDQNAGHQATPDTTRADLEPPNAVASERIADPDLGDYLEQHPGTTGRRCAVCEKPTPYTDWERCEEHNTVVVQGVSLNPPSGDNLANGLPVVDVEIPTPRPRKMPRARRNKDGPTVLDVIAEIFRRSPIPRSMSVAEIVAAATGDVELPTNSKTPHTIVSRDLALDVKHNGDASRFVRTAPGRFCLRDQCAHLGIVIDSQSAEVRDSFSAGRDTPGEINE